MTQVYGVAIGDSNVKADGLQPGEAFHEIVASNLNETIINEGVNGNNAYEALWRLDGIFTNYEAQNVYFYVGILDIYVNAQTEFIISVYKSLIENTIRLNGDCNIYLIVPCLSTAGRYWPKFYGTAFQSIELVEYLSDLYPNSNIHLVDLFGRMYQEGGSTAGYNSFFSDGLHLNASGHAKLADVLEGN